jgi:hypothetical protein
MKSEPMSRLPGHQQFMKKKCSILPLADTSNADIRRGWGRVHREQHAG